MITGATSGIGRATAIGLAEAGYRVAICGRRADELAETAKAAGAALCARPATSPIRRRWRDSLPGVRDKLGRIDVVFNNAGAFAPRPSFGDIDIVDLAEHGRHQSQRRLLRRPRGVPRHARPEPAGWPDHQQRLDLGLCAAAGGGGLHGDQARDHGTDQGDLARWAGVQHRLRPDRHRQHARPT